MKRFFCLFFLLVISFFFVLPVNAMDDNNINIYLFYGDGCPHCAEEKKFLNSIESKYDNINFIYYEVWKDSDNRIFLEQVKKQLGISQNGVPVTVIGESVIVGYSDAIGSKIERAIKFYTENEYEDVVSSIKEGTYIREVGDIDEFSRQEEEIDGQVTVDIPLGGRINLRSVSLSTAALVLGLIDGFNPCAMWVLLFLISMLISMKDRKRMWAIGLTFLVSSALVYMLMMLSWLNVVIEISTSLLLRNVVALIALGGGIFNIYNYFKHHDSGCSVVDQKKRKSVFERIRKFTKEKSLVLALVGTVALAFSVNIIELACSAGLPLVYTQLLAINDINGFKAFLYILLYIFFFLLDDLFIFFTAMKTMEVTGISTKYSKYSHLIGGILMFIIGLLLLFKPEWLMFQFN